MRDVCFRYVLFTKKEHIKCCLFRSCLLHLIRYASYYRIRHSRIIIIAIIFRHCHRRPSRSFSHHLSRYRGSSWKFILIKVSFGFPLDLHNTKTKITKLKKSCGFFFLTFTYKIKNSFIANKKLTTPIKHHNVTQRFVFCDFSDLRRYCTVSIGCHTPVERQSYLALENYYHGHHLSSLSSSSFSTISSSYFSLQGFMLDLNLHNTKTEMTKLKSQFKTHFNQFPLPISIRYSGPSSSMSVRGNHKDLVEHDYLQAARFFSYPFRHTPQDRFSPLKNGLCCYGEGFHQTNHKLNNLAANARSFHLH